MSKPGKSWRQKLLDSHGLPKVEEISDRMLGREGTVPGDTIAIPAPIEIDEFMKRVPFGKLVTVADIRAAVARKHDANIA